MKVLLLITTLDVAGRRNNREHAVLREMAPGYDRTILVYRRRPEAGRGLARLMRGTVERRQDGALTWIAVEPPLSPPEGSLRGATTHRPGASALRRAIGRSMDTAAILRDRLTIRALRAAARSALTGVDPATVDVEAFGPWAAEAARRLREEGVIGAFAYIDRDYEPGFVTSAARKAWAQSMERKAARSADLVLSIGHRLAERHRRDAGVSPVLSPTGVDAGFFTAPARPTSPLHIVYVGEVAPWSALDVLIAALDDPDLAGTRVSVRGPALPAYRTHLLRIAEPLGLRFDWEGDVDRARIPGLLSQANLGWCVFQPTPLRAHAAPLKLLEYLAAGLPVLAAPDSEAGDLVAAHRLGRIVAAEPLAVRDALRAMQQDEAGHAGMAARAVEVAAAHDWRAILRTEARLLAQLRETAAIQCREVTA